MKDREQQEEARLAKLIRAGMGSEVRPTAPQRAQAWQRLQATWRAEQQPAQQQRPVAAAEMGRATHIFPDQPVNHRVGPELRENGNQTRYQRSTFMSLLMKNRWGFGLSAFAAAAAVMGIIALSTPKAQAKAAEVMAKGAQAVAKLTTIHLRGQLRTLPADNFSYIDPNSDFHPIELWKQFGPELKWRVEKPGRVVLMDGQSTVHYIKPGNQGVKLPHPATSAFDTDWLHRIANLSQTISNELRRLKRKAGSSTWWKEPALMAALRPL